MSIASFNPGQRSGGVGSAPSRVAPVSAPATLATPTPADKAPAPASPAPPHFADLLRRSRDGATPPAAPVATPTRVDEPADAAGTGETSTIEAKAAPANAAKARAATPKGAVGKAAGADPTTTSGNVWYDVDGEGGVRGTGHDDDDERPAATLPSLACGADVAPKTPTALDGSHLPRRAFAPEVDEAGANDGSASVRDSAARRLELTIATGRDARSERQDGVAQADASAPAAADGSVLAAFTDLAVRQEHADAPPVHRSIDSVGSSFATSAAPQPLASAQQAVTSTALPTPIDSPDFAAALGVQVSVLAKDGVQQAELHLNPAELGPVSIHISLDGNAARVDFGADVAATRAVIERGLPELASALQDAGFTLAGGGVSQHAGGRSAEENEPTSEARRIDGARAAAGMAAMNTAPARVTRRIAAGGVDLYA